MKFCSVCRRIPICDVCIWYAFNGGEPGGWVYIGAGYCRLNGENRDPADGCENFVCCCWYAIMPVVNFDGWVDG